ncbi:MAG: sialate O-acetylesterase [Kiritimatiellales bacterium]|nr:sialate O-acetylesterase [Kiritimatiellales bacterium]
MKKIAGVVLVMILASLVAQADGLQKPDAGKKIKVFLLAGQSNMDGRGDGGKLTADDKARLEKAQQHVRFAYNRNPIVPLDVTVPTSGTAKKFNLKLTFGPELFFGLGMSQAWPDEKILFIKRSIGGTSLYGCWNPDWTVEKATVMKEEKKEKLYSDFIAYIKEVLSNYSKAEYEFCGILWVQGEADSGVPKYGPKPAETYGDNLQKLITGIRKETGVKDLPFMMLQVGGGQVVEGMQHCAQTMKNVSFIPQNKTDPQSSNYLPGYGPPTGHYNYEGMKRIGKMFAETYLGKYAP